MEVPYPAPNPTGAMRIQHCLYQEFCFGIFKNFEIQIYIFENKGLHVVRPTLLSFLYMHPISNVHSGIEGLREYREEKHGNMRF
jgi:hypothetical protein